MIHHTGPNLGARVGTPGWLFECVLFAGLIGGTLALGWYSQKPLAVSHATAAVEQTTPPVTVPPGTLNDAFVLTLNDTGAAMENTSGTGIDWNALTRGPAAPESSIGFTDPALAELDIPPPVTEAIVHFEKVGRGDTLITVLERAGVPRDDANAAVVSLTPNFNMRRLRAGQEVELTFDPFNEGMLTGVRLQPDVEKVVFCSRQEDGTYLSAVEEIELERTLVRAGGLISDSLYMAMDRSNVPHGVIGDLIHIFSWDVDFQREIRSGDRYDVFYEEYVDADGKAVKPGNILYAGLNLRGKQLDLYRFTPSDDKRADYFDANGQSVRKALLRTPVDGARLSSGFGRRHHPVLGYTKMHKGVDFAAPRGTPVRAAGDGVIERASRYGSFGNYVRIRHNNNYQTAYAHLNGYGKGIRSGVRVRQGEIIGYIGTTGRSTGPHLHYEVHKNGGQVNPLGLKLPTGRTLEGVQLAAYQAMLEDRMTLIAQTPISTQIAIAAGE